MELDTARLENFIADYPIYEYRILDAGAIAIEERVRVICRQECERYGTTWACPPGVGSLKECGDKIHSFSKGIFFQCGRGIGSYEYGGDAFNPPCP